MLRYGIARLDQLEELADHAYRYRAVRHHFGITSFGVTAWTAPNAGEPVIADYDEDSEPQEELFLVVSGQAVFDLEGERVEAGPGTFVYSQPGVSRSAVASEADTTVLAFGGSPGKAYDATGWELWAPVVPLYESGRYEELARRLRELTTANPQYPMLMYNLACCESMSGRTTEAIEHLRQAIDDQEKFRVDARHDSDLDPIRHDPAFEALVTDHD
jgi:tetratricopeptide (TPR) repeat protein